MAGSLEFIKSASGTSVSSLSVTDCFSANYNVYYLSMVTNDLSTATDNNYRYIDNGGSVISDSSYDYASLFMPMYANFTEGKATNGSSALGVSFGNNGTEGFGLSMYIYNPFDSSSYSFAQVQSAFRYPAGGNQGYKSISVYKVAESCTGINFFPSSGTYDNIEINVYGVK
tara:strand:- start:72 stop:584 length:513 start_codon:yes stop_codon:yes gene_type:complete